MRRTARLAVAIATGTLALALPATAAVAADATGCSGEVVSLDSGGTEIGRASAPGAGGTQSDPLPIDQKGTVAWKGSTDSVITNGTWSVSVMGASFLSGSFDNAEGVTSKEGVQSMSELPTAVTWVLQGNPVIPVSGSLTGDGGTCTASGFITGTGSPTSSPMFYAGLGTVVVGGVLVAIVLMGTKAGAAAGAAGASAAGASAAGSAGGTVKP